MRWLALTLVLAASSAAADPVDAIVRDKLAPLLPAGLGVRTVFLPRALEKLDVDSEKVVIELPRELRAGRASIRVTVPHRRAIYVPIAIDTLVAVAVARRAFAAGDVITAADLDLGEQAVADAATPELVPGARAARPIASGTPITTRDIVLPPPLPRGTQVTIELTRGAVSIRGSGTLELSARAGQAATARLSGTTQVLHGVLVAPSTVVVGGAP